MPKIMVSLQSILCPQRIGGLIPVATDCGIPLRIEAKPETARLFSEMIRLGTNEAKIAASHRLFAKQTFVNNPQVIQRYTAVSQRYPASQKMSSFNNAY
jgi:hypothetical protein